MGVAIGLAPLSHKWGGGGGGGEAEGDEASVNDDCCILFKLEGSPKLLFSLFAKRCGGGRKEGKEKLKKKKWPNRILYKGKVRSSK